MESFNIFGIVVQVLFVLPIIGLFIYLIVVLRRMRKQTNNEGNEQSAVAQTIEELDEREIVLKTEIGEERKKLQQAIGNLDHLLHEVRE
ncbi:hypothetical protein [Geomicrobium sp. JCM 19039]|uniref:hypothetical protein n=1 Tax=Geomicrobium sp. JCM 19039 TaxID=1460636 RepID=UPI00045F2887|nr:hypothetical protein [Geomicrobium sp. JCM 19039]GAK10588.1 hypothetical protein JCM19039_214 [Geomicrobium sp. JCM 19039]